MDKDVFRPAFVRRLLEETIKQSQRDGSLQNIIMTNAEDRYRIFSHPFSRASHEVRETPVLFYHFPSLPRDGGRWRRCDMCYSQLSNAL